MPVSEQDLERQRRFYRRFARIHGAVLVRTKAREFPRIRARRHRFLVLETVGARTGQPRHVPLLYLEEGGSFVVLASNFGQEKPPAWLANLRGRPTAHVLLRGRRVAITWRVVEEPERSDLVERMRAYNKQWNDYFKHVTRELPVVVLTPE